ncbi:MAG: anthranilate phosphoribosyltransferase family protein [Trichodesmium sp. MAG_R02]|jgi:anthranilate phosphoribosyltransferase|nr:anthranilate phosphoribosyltransferase family protein [Trichodesmium sp. MAG_R02]MDE5110448.1 anthranilate phosphoribosyltransferase family protein [Trichodesmium sp. St7_bin2_1]
MSDRFRELLKTIGSGTHTGKNLTRQEAAAAMGMMLLGEATPAQIGAFLIAHRIKRPTGEELAGMLDAYNELGPKLKSRPSMGIVTILGCPYDGRSRTAPITPLTALILATAGVFVVMHGGARMPTKEGIPFIEIWQGLGVEWGKLSLVEVQQVFEETGLGFVYLPKHFPQADALVEYRRDIGKRAPIATMELILVPLVEEVHLAAGYVHPPTEGMFREAFKLHGLSNYTTVKGLEGSCDLPRDRTAIIGVSVLSGNHVTFERLFLRPSDYGCGGKEVPLGSTVELVEEMQQVLQGKMSQLMSAAIWNGGFYLWRCGICSDINKGLSKAESLLNSSKVADKLREIKAKIGI